MHRYIAFTSIVIALLTLCVWAISQFVQPILPSSVNGGLVLLFVALLAVVGFFSQLKNAVQFFQALLSPSTSEGQSQQESKIVTGPVQLAIGNTTNITVNVTYVFSNAGAISFASQSFDHATIHRRDSPREVPVVPKKFVGRQAEVAFLKKALLQKDYETHLVAIVGLGGIGKTSLAAVVASDPEVEGQFLDGTFWADFYNLPDFGQTLLRWIQTLSPNTLLSGSNDTPLLLGYLSALLQTKRVLIVLDGAERIPEAQFMISALSDALGPNCKLLITSRWVNIPAARTILALDMLPEYDSVSLLEEEIGRKLSPDERVIASEIAFLAGYHPLVLALAGGYLKTGEVDLKNFRDLMRRQISKEKVIGLDVVRELSITRSLDYIYEKLSNREKFALCAFSIIDEGKPITTALVCLLCDVEVAEATNILSNLLRYALLAEVAKEQFAFSHKLVLDYSRRIFGSLVLAEQEQIRKAYAVYSKRQN